MRKAIRMCKATKAMGAAKEQAQKARGVFAKNMQRFGRPKKAVEAKVAAMKDASKIVEKGSVAERMKVFQRAGKRRRKSKRRRSRKKSRKPQKVP